jgi:glycyl-tRNA synthetase beta chain
VIERLRAYYLEGGAGFVTTTEMFDAVLATRPASPLDFDARLRALAAFLELPDARSIAAANKRIVNILRKATERCRHAAKPPARPCGTDPRGAAGDGAARGARHVAREYTEALGTLAALPCRRPVLRLGHGHGGRSCVCGNRLAMLSRMQSLFIRRGPVATAR